MLFNKLIPVLTLCFSVTTVAALERDPTQPPVTASYTEQVVHNPLTLSLVMKQQGGWRAIINEKMVGVDDQVENARVMMIDEDQVVLSRAGEKIILHMSIDDIRRDGAYEDAF